jgi:hypothetical protein
MRFSIRRIFLASFTGAVACVFALAAITNVSTDVSADDRRAFETILGLKRPDHTLSYSEELQLIRTLQSRILTIAPEGPPIPEYQSREPLDLLRNRTGLCYDRSRTLEKLFAWMGFEVRHVYILFLTDLEGRPMSPLQALFTPGSPSHAVTEVKTQRGWMIVDSNSPWIGVTDRGIPVRTSEVFSMRKSLPDMPEYFAVQAISVPGLYSRRGQFYRPFIPFPELSWPTFLGAWRSS